MTFLKGTRKIITLIDKQAQKKVKASLDNGKESKLRKILRRPMVQLLTRTYVRGR